MRKTKPRKPRKPLPLSALPVWAVSLRQQMKAKGYTVEELAKELDVGERVVYWWRSGRFEPYRRHVKRLKKLMPRWTKPEKRTRVPWGERAVKPKTLVLGDAHTTHHSKREERAARAKRRKSA